MQRASRKRYRVIQWGTGNAGRKAVAGIVRHPDLELVGVHAHAPEKVGRDAAELAGLSTPTGVRATDDVEALLALEADCVSYMAQGETRIRETVDDLCRILAAGKNVVNTAIVSLVYPPFSSPKLRDRLEEACRAGGTTLFTSGFDPGWSGDVIPLAMASVCERVDSIRVSELMDYSTYEDPGFTGVYFGFGRPLDFDAPLLRPGMLKGGWGGMVVMLADALGVSLDEIREVHERLPAPESFDTKMGRIEQGRPAIGVVRMPALGETFAGALGIGATLNGQPVRVRGTERLDEAMIWVNEAERHMAADPARFARLCRIGHTRRMGYDCYPHAMVAAGQIDAVIDMGLEPYDYMPLIALVEAAGGLIRDWQGKPLDLNSDGRVVTAATPALLDQVLEVLAG